jgi:peroxiredoxin
MASINDLINTLATDFALPIVGGGGRLILSDLRGQFVVIHFWSAECPWSRRADLVLVYRQQAWEKLNIRIVGVACNANESENEIRNEAATRHLKYPLAADYAQDITNAYRIQITPTFVILDRRGYIRYVGAIDDANANQRLPKVIYLDRALYAITRDQTPNPTITQPYGSAVVRRTVGA